MTDADILLLIVRAGVFQPRQMSWHLMDDDGDVVAVFTDARLAVRDWRVAGTLMQMVKQVRVKPLPIAGARWVANVEVPGYAWFKASNDSYPRAVIEACAKAITDHDGHKHD